MGGFSIWHWIVIAALALLLFGNRLPDVARSLGRSVNEFKRGLKEVKDDLEDEADADEQARKRLRQPPDGDQTADPAGRSTERSSEPAGSAADRDES